MRRLTDLPGDTASSLAGVVSGSLDRRLRRDSPRPIAVALSGGGDSVALLLSAHLWAKGAGRPLLALSVDHRLQPQSGAWIAACAALAARLGVGFRALAWTGDKPATGLATAAREARHRLLADAARAAGVRVLLIGHTADDVLEAEAMRAAGATTPSPREWTPSPAWPQGRELFLLRPLLSVRRAAIREWLRDRTQAWIDDPANGATNSLRAQVRQRLDLSAPASELEERPLALAGQVMVDGSGGMQIDRRAFRDAPDADAQRLLAIAAVCAGGGDRLPSGGSAARLAVRIKSAAATTAVLAGARISGDQQVVSWTREAGEAARGGLAEMALPVGGAVVWDGRFELVTAQPGLHVRRLAGLSRRLPAGQQRALAELPAAARPGLPAIVAPDGSVNCPLLGGDGVIVRSLVGDRLRAACGMIAQEPA